VLKNQALRAQIAALDAQLELGSQPVSLLVEAFGIQLRGARILLRLYRAAPRYLPTSLLVPELTTPSEGNLKVAIHNLKKKIGAGLITSSPGAGYQLTLAGRRRLEQVLRPLADATGEGRGSD
jgi:hypothetical protein